MALTWQQFPGLSLVLAPQQILSRHYWLVGPIGLVRSKKPGTRICFRHAHNRHTAKLRVIFRTNDSHFRPSMAIIVGVAISNGRVFRQSVRLRFVHIPNRLCTEGIDTFGTLGDKRNETVLVVIDIKGNRWALPRFSFVARSVSQHVIDLAFPALTGTAIMSAVWKHHQIISFWRNGTSNFIQASLSITSSVDDLGL